MNYLLDLLLIPMQVIIVIYTVYYFILAVVGMWRSRVHKIIPLKIPLPSLYALIMRKLLLVS